jgi:VIT family protein
MAAGEYVSVSSQSDTERADLVREARELSEDPEFEKEELARIYADRGVELSLARKVAQQLMAKDALGAHARDELGISEISTARPVQAALASAATFSVGAAAPLVLILLSIGLASSHGFGGLVGFPRVPRHDRRKDRRRSSHASNFEGRLLGCSRDGPDGGDWGHSRHGSVGTVQLGSSP